MLTLVSLTAQNTSAAVIALDDFAKNPGELSASLFQPEKPSQSLVVLLHGCAQNALVLAEQTGLLEAAKIKGFYLLMPQQSKTNNVQLCFNWFSKTDQAGEQGEAASIMAMIESVTQEYNIANTYLAGLSAGGAMASGLAAENPDKFHSLAIIAGVAYPCADDLVKAISCMKNGMGEPVSKSAKKLLASHTEKTVWPNLTVITGAKDTIVNPKNSEHLAEQWRLIIAATETATEQLDGAKIQTHSNSKQSVQLIEVEGMGHGWPVNPEQTFGGSTALFLPTTVISATNYLVNLWAL